jgi:hypothetical protein
MKRSPCRQRRQYRRISTQRNKTGIQMDWTFDCSCHAKRPSDGSAQTRRAVSMPSSCCTRMTGRRAENCKRVLDVLQRKLLFTRKPIWDKKDLRGVTRRFAFFAPRHGPDAVQRPVLGCRTLQSACKPLMSARHSGMFRSEGAANELESQGQERPVHLRSARSVHSSRLQEADESRPRQSE